MSCRLSFPQDLSESVKGSLVSNVSFPGFLPLLCPNSALRNERRGYFVSSEEMLSSDDDVANGTVRVWQAVF